MSEYPKCPWCGHPEWHKTTPCEDTCCSGCPGGDGYCDCQRTEREIRLRNEGVYCYQVSGKDGCAEHNYCASWLDRDRCSLWQDGPAAWRSEGGRDPVVSD